MFNKIWNFLKKILSIFSIFRRKKARQQEILRQVKTYQESSLGLLLNTFAFIDSAKKTDEEINEEIWRPYVETVTRNSKSISNYKENSDAIS